MTDIILNQLYPGGVMKQLGDAAGGIVYDQYAPGGCMEQLRVAAGADPYDQYAPGGPARQVEVAVEGGGTPSVPAWVPANAVIHIDLVGGSPQGRAWVAGTGEVAVGTLLDPYNPNNLESSGYPASLYCTGALQALLVEATTFSLKVQQIDSNDTVPGSIELDLLSSDEDAGLWVNVYTVLLKNRMSSLGDLFLEAPNSYNNSVAGVKNNLAVTVTGIRLEMALNGDAPLAGTLNETDRPTEYPLVHAQIKIPYFTLVTSITLYDPLPSTAGLSDLSEVA